MEYNNFKTEILDELIDLKDKLKKTKKKKENDNQNPKKENEQVNNNENKNNKEEKTKKEKTKISKAKKIIIIVLSSLTFLTGSGLFLLYGPWAWFRETLITTAMTTLSHQYLATWFYSEETINKVLEKNKVINSSDISDLNDIVIKKYDNTVKYYANKYEEQVLKKDEGNDLYKLIELSGAGYKGYLVVVYDPSKIDVVHSKYLGSQGQLITTMAKENDAVIAINGGGFIDPNGTSLGGIPLGLTIGDGKVLYNGEAKSSIVGFTNDHKLVLGNMSASEALAMGVRDAIEFRPYLIVNGKPTTIYGNGGWGYGPRTAIGQRKDGIILMIVIDGRRAHSVGASIKELQELMIKYGAYNATNLDGGSSTTLVVNNEVMNNPVASTPSGMRNIPNAIIVKK